MKCNTNFITYLNIQIQGGAKVALQWEVCWTQALLTVNLVLLHPAYLNLLPNTPPNCLSVLNFIYCRTYNWRPPVWLRESYLYDLKQLNYLDVLLIKSPISLSSSYSLHRYSYTLYLWMGMGMGMGVCMGMYIFSPRRQGTLILGLPFFYDFEVCSLFVYSLKEVLKVL